MIKPVTKLTLAINLTKDDIEGSNDGNNISQHVLLTNMVNQGKVKEPGGLDLTPR